MLGILGLGAIFVKLNEIMGFQVIFIFSGALLYLFYENTTGNSSEIRFLVENLFFGLTRRIFAKSFP
jgi:hypothetical protein